MCPWQARWQGVGVSAVYGQCMVLMVVVQLPACLDQAAAMHWSATWVASLAGLAQLQLPPPLRLCPACCCSCERTLTW